MREKQYEKTHPWLTFSLNLKAMPYQFWLMLGECQSKIEHIAGVPLRPETAEQLNKFYLAKGIQATTAIEGNTLTEQEVLDVLEKKSDLPPSRQYLKQEIENILKACTEIRESAINDSSPACTVDRIKRFNKFVLEKLAFPDHVVPGEVSSTNVTVGRYRAAPRQDCEYLLSRLCDWINGPDFAPKDELQIGMAIIKAIVAHLYFEWIHPFGDGNGRTGRLLEFYILLTAGVPAPSAHLLSNHYNLTRESYYRELDRASKSGGDVVPFLFYAVQGFRDGLREQINSIKVQQADVVWRNYVHEIFRDKNGAADVRRRHLVLDLSRRQGPVLREDLYALSRRAASAYAKKGDKTLTRDLNILLKMRLIQKQPEGTSVTYQANSALISAFLPARRQK